MAWWRAGGRPKIRTVDLLPNIVVSGKLASGSVFRDAVPDDALYTDKLLEYHDNISGTSGGVTRMTVVVSHNLGSARIYGATVLSHASGLSVTAEVGGVNASQATVSWTHESNVVSGLGAHVFVIV